MNKKRSENTSKGKSNIYKDQPTLNKMIGIKLTDEQFEFVAQQPMTKTMYIRALIDKEMTK